MDVLFAFAGALVSLRLAAELLRRRRGHAQAGALLAWAAALLSFSLGSAALAWGAAAGWDDRSFRAYYLFGGLLAAALLGTGSLLLTGRRWMAPVALVYVGLAAGVAVAMEIDPAVSGSSVPVAQDHLAFLPARALAIVGNTLGTLAVVVVALAGLRRRALGNTLVLAGVAVAASGSALTGLGAAGTAAFTAVAAMLLYAGFVAPPGTGLRRRPQGRRHAQEQG